MDEKTYFPESLYITFRNTFGEPLIEVYQRVGDTTKDNSLQHVVHLKSFTIHFNNDDPERLTENSTLKDLARILKEKCCKTLPK